MAYNTKSTLAWVNIARVGMSEGTQAMFDSFIEAKDAFERALLRDAIERGKASQGDGAAYSYRSIGDGIVGFAVVKGKASRASGWDALPDAGSVKPTLAAHNAAMDAGGYRR